MQNRDLASPQMNPKQFLNKCFHRKLFFLQFLMYTKFQMNDIYRHTSHHSSIHFDQKILNLLMRQKKNTELNAVVCEVLDSNRLVERVIPKATQTQTTQRNLD